MIDSYRELDIRNVIGRSQSLESSNHESGTAHPILRGATRLVCANASANQARASNPTTQTGVPSSLQWTALHRAYDFIRKQIFAPAFLSDKLSNRICHEVLSTLLKLTLAFLSIPRTVR